MKFKYELVLGLGALALGISGNVVSAQSALRHCSTEACACEEALKRNTVEALETFLRKYPHADRGTSACAALAVPPRGDGGLAPEGESHDNSDSPNARPEITPSKGES